MSPQTDSKNQELESRVYDLEQQFDNFFKLGTNFAPAIDRFIVVLGPNANGAQLTFYTPSLAGVASVSILRNFSRDIGSAVALVSYTYLQLTPGAKITYTDTDPATFGRTVYYWIKATPLQPKFQATYIGPQIIGVPLSVNHPSNTGNFATVDSVDQGGGTGARVRIYGTGGVGSSYTYGTGHGQATGPAGTISNLAYATLYYVVWTGTTYFANTSFAAAQNLTDAYTAIGIVTTVNNGGGGGISGGGGAAGQKGCCEVGTQLEIPDGQIVLLELRDSEDWVQISFNGKTVRVDANTLISTFTRAFELKAGDMLEGPEGSIIRISSVGQYHRASKKMILDVRPGHTYFGGGIRMHNYKY